MRGTVRKLLKVAANFNVLLADAAHNEVLLAIIQPFVALMIERESKVYKLDGFREWDIAEHQGLFEAVRDQDSELAAERMRAHILDLAGRTLPARRRSLTLGCDNIYPTVFRGERGVL